MKKVQKEVPVFVERHGTSCSKWDGVKERFGVDEALPLWVADMDFAAPEAVQEAISQRAKHPIYGYTLYDDTFYEAIVQWYRQRFGWEIRREWIVPEHGVVVAMNLAVEALSSPGDGIIIQTPIYPPFFSAVKTHQRKLLENRLLLEEDGYVIDFDDLEAKAHEAKMLLLCSPHNPSTRAWSEGELLRIAEIARRHDLIVVSDEIHSDLLYFRKHHPFGALPEMRKRSLVLHAPSKSFNIAGLNTSFCIIPDDSLRRRYRQAHERTGLDNGNPFGIVALEAAYHEGEAWLEATLKYLEENIAYVREFMVEHTPRIRPLPVEATFLIWLDCRAMGMSDEELERFFLEEAKLALNPGRSFGETGSGFMRLNAGTSRKILEEAMERLKGAYDRRMEA